MCSERKGFVCRQKWVGPNHPTSYGPVVHLPVSMVATVGLHPNTGVFFNPSVLICYCRESKYRYIINILSLSLARDAMKTGNSPVIIDNTNTNAWEMKPYVLLVSNCDEHSKKY